MAITPNSVVHLLNVQLENNYKNQIYFANRSAQTTFMQSKIVPGKTYNDLSYVRKDNVLRVPEHIDNLYNCNYVMYQNTNYSNRWFYAFITKMEYVNDGRTDITIETDCWQTWFDLITLKSSFVEREHVSDDSVGLHTIPENLDIGAITCDNIDEIETFKRLNGEYWVIISSSYDPANNTRYAGMGFYGGYPQASPWFAFLVHPNQSLNNDMYAITQWILSVADAGHEESIQSIFTVPYAMIDENDVPASHLLPPGTGEKINDFISYNKAEFRSFSDYTPKNNKLFCYPYSFARITNNLGSFNDYRIEDFKTLDSDHNDSGLMNFRVRGIPCENVSAKITPVDYFGIANNEDESVVLGKFPTLGWSSDNYTNWLTQNSINLTTDLVGNTLGVIGNAIGLSPGGVVSSATGIFHSLGNWNKATMLPNNAQGNANTGDMSFGFNINNFKLFHLRPKKEYLETIDNYFEMFGYKVNTLKIPNISNRPQWNYVKTINANIDGGIPQEDLTKVRNMFDNGVTFWKNGNNVENYTLNNH